ncbi:pyridoxal phosphate-dependent transferase [Xylaria acuta]|nr:pyridoxal phosphate-dependent transferase [Xylaria acuta]
MATGIENKTWLGSAGSAAYDLRSDTMTTPTAAMLAAIASCSLQDDVFQEDNTTNDLEGYCAALTDKESGLFVLSGTMGNQLGLRALLTQPPHAVLCDHRSHIVTSEAGGVALLTSAMVNPVIPRNGLYLTLADVEENFRPEGRIVACPTRVISLENTLHGVVTPLEEVRKIAAFARERGVKMHCDGARLWEAVAAGAGSLTDYAACFDTVSLCFSKGLGAPVGSILVGDRATLGIARHVRKAIGGGLRQPGLVTAAARVAVEETFGKGSNGEGGLLKHSHATARRIETMWRALGGATKVPVDTNIVWLDLKSAGISMARFNEIGKEEGLKLMGERLVVHYQIYQNAEDTLGRLQKVFERAWAERGNAVSAGADAKASVY